MAAILRKNKMKEIKFEDLKFKEHEAMSGQHAVIEFENGFGASVVFGEMFYSNGIDNYELGVLKDGNLHYDNEVANGDVVGYLKKKELMKLINKIANFESEETKE